MKIEIEGGERIRKALEGLIPKLQRGALKKGAQTAYTVAKDAADSHYGTGALVRSTKIRPTEGGYEIIHDSQIAPHAVFVHWGSKPHVIEPNKKRVLRWPTGAGGNTKFAFAKIVHHPGYKGDAWLIRARDQAADAMEKFVGDIKP